MNVSLPVSDIRSEVQVLGEAGLIASVASVMCDDVSVTRQTIRQHKKKATGNYCASAGYCDIAIILYS